MCTRIPGYGHSFSGLDTLPLCPGRSRAWARLLSFYIGPKHSTPRPISVGPTMADNIHAPHSSGLAPMAVFVCVHFLLASPASIAYHLTMVSHFNIGDYWGVDASLSRGIGYWQRLSMPCPLFTTPDDINYLVSQKSQSLGTLPMLGCWVNTNLDLHNTLFELCQSNVPCCAGGVGR